MYKYSYESIDLYEYLYYNANIGYETSYSVKSLHLYISTFSRTCQDDFLKEVRNLRETALSPFGLEAKIAMLKRGMKQVELIDLVKQDTGLYVDDSYMYKILHGDRSAPKVIQSICKILDIEYREEGGKTA